MHQSPWPWPAALDGRPWGCRRRGTEPCPITPRLRQGFRLERASAEERPRRRGREAAIDGPRIGSEHRLLVVMPPGMGCIAASKLVAQRLIRDEPIQGIAKASFVVPRHDESPI